MSFTIPTIFTAVDKLTAPIRKMTSGVQGFVSKTEAKVARLDRRLRKLTPTLGGVGKQIIAFASAAALVAGVQAAIVTVKDYEQANANLAAKMGVTVDQNRALAEDSIRLGSITAKTSTEVSELQFAYAGLGFSQKEILDVTEATIRGSIAMNAELANTAELTGAVIRTFDAFESQDAGDILDKMTLATQKSALNFEKLESALPNVAGAANAAGVNFNQLLGLLGKLSDAGIDASASGTALKNIFIKAAAKGSSYGEILEDISKSSDKLTASNDEFGKIAAVSGTILANKLSEIDILTKDVAENFKGVADEAAKKQLDTFGGSLTLLGSAYEGLLLKMNDSTDGLGFFRKGIDFVTKNIETIAKVIGVAVGAFLAMKVAIFAAQAGLLVYNIALGVSSALSATASIAVGANTVALTAYNIASKAVTAAIWLWTGAQTVINILMTANPIGLIIVGIAALIALITLIIVKYDEWGAALTFILGPLGMIINLIMAFRRNWEMISDAFSQGGILAGFKAIGAVILDSILMPLQQMMMLIEKIPGLDFGLSDKIGNLRAELGVDTGESSESGGSPSLVNNKVAERDGIVDKLEEKTTKEILLKVEAEGANTEVSGDTKSIGISMGSTTGFN